jgi:hypothetical protein
MISSMARNGRPSLSCARNLRIASPQQAFKVQLDHLPLIIERHVGDPSVFLRSRVGDENVYSPECLDSPIGDDRSGSPKPSPLCAYASFLSRPHNPRPAVSIPCLKRLPSPLLKARGLSAPRNRSKVLAASTAQFES